MRGSVTTLVAAWLISAVSLTGCVEPGEQLMTTLPGDDFVVETQPVADEELEEEVVLDEVVFATVEECLQGNWEVNNEAFGAYFAQGDDRVVDIDVAGLATLTIEDDTYRMFFEDWGIRYETGDPLFLLNRNGNETVQFEVTPEGVLEVLERDDQIVLEFFSLVGDDGFELIAIATNDPGPLPIDGATLQCTANTLQVFVDGANFSFDRL